MFMRRDKLLIDLPEPFEGRPNAASALNEILGGKFGEMSTLNNYMFQSFNFREKHKLSPFYSLVASITAEELGHVELVTNGIALLNQGPARAGPEGASGRRAPTPSCATCATSRPTPPAAAPACPSTATCAPGPA
jgi:Mn-containing catalase